MKADVAKHRKGIASAFQSWREKMVKAVLGTPLNADEWFERDANKAEGSSASIDSPELDQSLRQLGGAFRNTRGKVWVNLKTGVTQNEHPHAKYVRINIEKQQREAQRQLDDRIKALQEHERNVRTAQRKTEAIHLAKRMEVWWELNGSS